MSVKGALTILKVSYKILEYLYTHSLIDSLLSDASGKAIGFMLAQMYDNMLKPIMFRGRVLSEAEQRYATVDKELLACYFAIKKCEIYVLGYDFIVYTDHKPLINLKGFKDVINRRYRWIEYLESMSVR